MLSAEDIKNIKFSKSVGGYKPEEVDNLLDKVIEDYRAFKRTVDILNGKIESLEKDNSEIETTKDRINSVLLNAQKLADNIIADAKTQSDEIVKNAEKSIETMTAKEKELSSAFEIKAKERKSALEKELSDMIRAYQIKADSIMAAANDSVSRQQLIFDRLKMEVAAFKAGVTAKYKEHLELLRQIPDMAPIDPTQMSRIVTEKFDKVPDPESFIINAVNSGEISSKSEQSKSAAEKLSETEEN